MLAIIFMFFVACIVMAIIKRVFPAWWNLINTP
jgi:hypothetical protein